jgi:hypothetical protein
MPQTPDLVYNQRKVVANEERSRPGTGPAPRALTEEELSRLLREQQFGVLASVRCSGHPHLSTVLYHWDPKQRVLRISTTADRPSRIMILLRHLQVRGQASGKELAELLEVSECTAQRDVEAWRSSGSPVRRKNWGLEDETTTAIEVIVRVASLTLVARSTAVTAASPIERPGSAEGVLAGGAASTSIVPRLRRGSSRRSRRRRC